MAVVEAVLLAVLVVGVFGCSSADAVVANTSINNCFNSKAATLQQLLINWKTPKKYEIIILYKILGAQTITQVVIS